MAESKFSAYRNPVRLWKSLTRRPKVRTDFVSVGVTSKTADSVLLAPGEVRLLTRLRVLDFVTGESDLRCLRRLVSEGVPVFHHPEVRANVVVSKDLTASLGSRGLQAASTSARHLSWATAARTTVKETQDLVDSWFADAEPVTLELIKELEEHISPKLSPLKKLARSAGEIDKKIEAGKPEREAKRKQQDLDQRRREAGVERFIAAADRAAAHSEVKYCYMQYLVTNYGTSDNHTLLADESKLLTWNLGGEQIHLAKTFRYLFVVPELGRVAWARVMETRITKVGNGVEKGWVTIAGKLFKVGYDADWGNSRANVSLTLRRSVQHGLDKPVTIKGFFSIDGLEIVSIDGQNKDEVDFLQSHADEVSADIARDLLEAFRYQQNLVGHEIDKFLAPYHRWWKLRLGRFEGKPFIVGEMA